MLDAVVAELSSEQAEEEVLASSVQTLFLLFKPHFFRARIHSASLGRHPPRFSPPQCPMHACRWERFQSLKTRVEMNRSTSQYSP